MKFHYVRMVESPLNFELSLHLAEEVKLFEHVLKDYFKGARLSRDPLNCLEDLAEFAAANRLDACEVVNCPTFLIFGSITLMLCMSG